jgi:hypothetical protein
MPNRQGPFDPGMKNVNGRPGSLRMRSRSEPAVTVIGRHSFPLVCRRPSRMVSSVARGSTSASTPYPLSAAWSAAASGPIGGTRTRLPSAAISGRVRAASGRIGAAAAASLARERRSSRTQWRNASTRVFVPASPAWPSVSMIAKGFPSMSRW